MPRRGNSNSTRARQHCRPNNGGRQSRGRPHRQNTQTPVHANHPRAHSDDSNRTSQVRNSPVGSRRRPSIRDLRTSGQFTPVPFEYLGVQDLVRVLKLSGRAKQVLQEISNSIQGTLTTWNTRCCIPGCQSINPGERQPPILRYRPSDEASWHEKLEPWEAQYTHKKTWQLPHRTGQGSRHAYENDTDLQEYDRVTHHADTHGLYGYPAPLLTQDIICHKSNWCDTQRALYRQLGFIGRRGRGESLWNCCALPNGEHTWAAIMREDGSTDVRLEDFIFSRTHYPDQDLDAIRSILLSRRLSNLMPVSVYEWHEADQWLQDYNNDIVPNSSNANESLQRSTSHQRQPSTIRTATNTVNEGQWEQVPEDHGFFEQTRGPHPRLATAIANLKILEIAFIDQAYPNCLICLEDYKIGDICYLLPCRHMFHLLCMAPLWREKPNGECPMCRKSIILGQIPGAADESATRQEQDDIESIN